MDRVWHGPLARQVVTDAWQGYASCLFIEFGELKPAELWTDASGNERRSRPRGEWTLTSMDSFPAWRIYCRERLIATSACSWSCRARGLRLLVGRQLWNLQINQDSLSTRLRFSLGVTLETQTKAQGLHLHTWPHWLMRGPQHGDDDWPGIPLKPWV